MGKTGTIADWEGAIGPSGDPTLAFHPSWRPAEHDTGIVYVGPWEDPYGGFPEHVRRCARALANTGTPVHLRSYDATQQWHIHFEVGGDDKTKLREQYEDLLTTTIKNPKLEIYQVVPDDVLFQRLTTHQFLDPTHLAIINRYRIASVVFERDRVSEHMATCMNRLGQIWVANETDRKMLERCGVERVRVVPIPFFDTDPLLNLRYRKRLSGPVRFYHIGKWEPRKAHHEMLGTFFHAFKPGEARLIFKTSTTAPDYGDYPSSPEVSVHQWMNDAVVKQNGWDINKANQDVHFIRQRISQEQIVKLHKTGDVYLSLSRGEGFDMPAYDAVLAGNIVVYTPTGGPSDFAPRFKENVPVYANESLPCHPFYRWGDDARYLDWSLKEAVSALREAKHRVEHPLIEDDTAMQWGPFYNRFGVSAVGEQMLKHINETLVSSKAFVDSLTKTRRVPPQCSGTYPDGSQCKWPSGHPPHPNCKITP